MDRARAGRVFDRMSKATMKELEEWNRVEVYAKNIHDDPELRKPLRRPEVKGFTFVQRYNRTRAKAVQAEIDDLINAERLSS